MMRAYDYRHGRRGEVLSLNDASDLCRILEGDAGAREPLIDLAWPRAIGHRFAVGLVFSWTLDQACVCMSSSYMG